MFAPFDNGEDLCSDLSTIRLPTCVNMNCFADERSHVLLLVMKGFVEVRVCRVFSRYVMKVLKILINWPCQTYIPSIRVRNPAHLIL
jgi:hypothetical protein